MRTTTVTLLDCSIAVAVAVALRCCTTVPTARTSLLLTQEAFTNFTLPQGIIRPNPLIQEAMRVVALISGGKDSCYNMMQCIAAGHDVVAVAHLTPARRRGSAAADGDEVDSFMYQSVGSEAVGLYALALELPLYQRTFEPDTALCLDATYVPTDGDEVEALHDLLADIKIKEQISAVSVGAILSNYQRVRVENVCSRLGLTVLAYMWRRNQDELLAEMIAANLRAIVIKVATLGLTPAEHLGKDIADIYPHLLQMKERYGLNVCGEGGEYETFTLDCPLFKKSIVIEEQEIVQQDTNEISPVAYLRFTKCSLEPKPITLKSNRDVLREVGIRGPLNFLVDLDVHLSVIDGPPKVELIVTDVPSWRTATITSPPFVTNLRNGWVSIGDIIAGRTDDVAEATTDALRLLTGALASEHMSFGQLVSIQLFVANMDDFGKINGAYKEFFDVNPPSRVCVQVPLPKDVCLIMDCVAYRGENVMTHMHVQGVSHWAPANIGPYSQAVQVTDAVTHVAGQIALMPGTMQLIADVTGQCRLSLRHARRVLEAMHPESSRIAEDVVSCVCYVTNPSYAQIARDALSWNGQSDHDDVVIYVVVSGLPRSASVEWQVVASNSGFTKRFQLEDVIISDAIKITSSCASSGLTILQCRCSATTGVSEVLESTLTDVFKHVDGLVQSTSIAVHDNVTESTTSAHYQVFFNVNKITYDQLKTAWKKYDASNGLTLIPVLAAHAMDESVFMNLLVRI